MNNQQNAQNKKTNENTQSLLHGHGAQYKQNAQNSQNNQNTQSDAGNRRSSRETKLFRDTAIGTGKRQSLRSDDDDSDGETLF